VIAIEKKYYIMLSRHNIPILWGHRIKMKSKFLYISIFSFVSLQPLVFVGAQDNDGQQLYQFEQQQQNQQQQWEQQQNDNDQMPEEYVPSTGYGYPRPLGEEERMQENQDRAGGEFGGSRPMEGERRGR
jgi:hypothetical protein